MKLRNTLYIIALLAVVMQASAQQKKSDMLFKHVGIGVTAGTTGIGIEAATPINENLCVRAGVQVLGIGTIKINLPVTNADIYKFMDIKDDELSEASKTNKVQVGIDAKIVTGDVLLDFYPNKDKAFHITAGAYFGNKDVLHIYNTQDGSLKFINTANDRVDTYNELFGTTYKQVGIEFGDYIFTADKDGNISAKMKVWAVRPYIGVGWGHHVAMTNKHKIYLNFDLGAQIWGRPDFDLNNSEKVIDTGDSNEGGIFRFMSGLKFYPTLKVAISGDVFCKKSK